MRPLGIATKHKKYVVRFTNVLTITFFGIWPEYTDISEVKTSSFSSRGVTSGINYSGITTISTDTQVFEACK